MARGEPKKEPTLELPDLKLPHLRRRSRTEQDVAVRRGREPRAQRAVTRPLLPGRVAAALTGVVVGFVGVGGTYAGLTGCEAVRGVSTCGGGTGLLLLVAILALMLLVGAGLLRVLRVGNASATSFLGVGIVTVVSMLVLLEIIHSGWMLLVLPTVTGASYLAAHWVTARFAGDRGRRDWT